MKAKSGRRHKKRKRKKELKHIKRKRKKKICKKRENIKNAFNNQNNDKCLLHHQTGRKQQVLNYFLLPAFFQNNIFCGPNFVRSSHNDATSKCIVDVESGPTVVVSTPNYRRDFGCRCQSLQSDDVSTKRHNGDIVYNDDNTFLQ